MNIRVQGVWEAKRIAGVLMRAHEGLEDERLKSWLADCAMRIMRQVEAITKDREEKK